MKTDTMRRLQCLQATIQAQTTPCAWMLDENGIDLFTVSWEQTHINPGCMRENDLTTTQSVRLTAATSLLDQLAMKTIFHEPHEQNLQQSAEDTSIRHSTIKHMTR